MKFIDVILTMVIFTMFIGMFTKVVVPCSKIYGKTKEIEFNYERDKFIYMGIKNICEEKNKNLIKDKLISFQKMCINMWPIDYIKVTNEKNMYKAEWKANSKEMLILIKSNN